MAPSSGLTLAHAKAGKPVFAEHRVVPMSHAYIIRFNPMVTIIAHDPTNNPSSCAMGNIIGKLHEEPRDITMAKTVLLDHNKPAMGYGRL